VNIWFDLVLPDASSSKDAGSGDPAYNEGQDEMGSYFGFTCLDRHVFGATSHSGQKSTIEGRGDSRRQPIVSVITI
jgi:hypothetical protein